jgi:hypothetical protein
VKGQCRLNGTVNYGTLGIIARLCHNRFPGEYVVALRIAEAATRGYKLVISKEDASGVAERAGVPTNPGNRPQCNCKCPYDGTVVTWDYVWEPWKTRHERLSPN